MVYVIWQASVASAGARRPASGAAATGAEPPSQQGALEESRLCIYYHTLLYSILCFLYSVLCSELNCTIGSAAGTL